MSAHVQQAGFLSGRSMTFVAVVGLHAVVIAALIAIRIVPDMIDPGPKPLTWFRDVTPPDPVPPMPRLPDVNPRLPSPVPIPYLEPIEAAAESENTIQVPAVVAAAGDPDATTPTAVPAPAHVSTELRYEIVRPTDDYYPDTSVMLEERGIAIVQVCVDAAGRIAGQPTVQSSSGHKRLDQAAIRWARESLRFSPATLDGVGVAACKGFRVNFNLR